MPDEFGGQLPTVQVELPGWSRSARPYAAEYQYIAPILSDGRENKSAGVLHPGRQNSGGYHGCNSGFTQSTGSTTIRAGTARIVSEMSQHPSYITLCHLNTGRRAYSTCMFQLLQSQP
jgi:hypothetical protein